jgi:hypothetical protein
VPPQFKVALVAAFPPPPGGMPHQARMLAEILARDGARVVAINTNPFGRCASCTFCASCASCAAATWY